MNELIQCFINIINNSKDNLKDMEDDKYFFISTKLYEYKGKSYSGAEFTIALPQE
ncbi:MAG: hypothetical protein U9Q33_13140 [Campylobacterota bacterium]|nr:hypothetical protein [Campylobacterota bacterium]